MDYRSVSELRFTQDSIRNTFQAPYDYQRIDDAVDQIGNNELDPSVFMPLNVVQHRSMLWSLDNRRLWVLRKAGVPTVEVTFVPPNHNRRSVEFFASLNDPHALTRYSSATYFPRVRGEVRSVGIKRGKETSDGVQMLYPTKEVADVKRTTGIPPSLLPHHLRSGAISIDMPAKVINYEASSNCFHKESNPIPKSTTTAFPHLRDVSIFIVTAEDLRFTQDSIKNAFKRPYEYQRIDDAVDQIGNNQLNPSVFMPLNVVQFKTMLWSLDNRRLWVLRKAGVATVKVTLVPPNHNRRSVEFFASLNDPDEVRRYCSATYFPSVRGGVRSVGIHPPLPPHHLTSPTNVRFTQNFNVGSSSGGPPPPPPAMPNTNTTTPASHLTDVNTSTFPQNPTPVPNTIFPNNMRSPPHPSGGNKHSLWARMLDIVNCVKEMGLGFFRSFASHAFDPFNEKFVKIGKYLLPFMAICVIVVVVVLRQRNNNQGKASVDSKLLVPKVIHPFSESITAIEGGNSESDEKSKTGYIGIVAVKAAVGEEKIVSHLFSRMFCFLRFVERNCVDLSKGIVMGGGRMAKDGCKVILRECFSRLHFITGQVAVSTGRMGICVSQFCLQKFWELLLFIKSQAFGLFWWSEGKVGNVLRFYASSPQIGLAFGFKKVGELGKGVIGSCLSIIKDLLWLAKYLARE